MKTRILMSTTFSLALLVSPALSWKRVEDAWLWTEEAVVASPSPDCSSGFGRSLALDGETALIGAPGEDWGGGRPGAAYVLVKSGSTWTTEARLVASDAADYDSFGNAVALQGDLALVGAAGDDDGGSSSGSVYVFVRSAGLWNQVAKLTAPDAGPSEYFGSSVALGGNVALVGAPYDDGPGGQNSGSAYVFIGSGANWTFLQKLEAADAKLGDQFGQPVALSGTTALIGAERATGGVNRAGAAYVFTKYGGAWHEQAKLQASDGLNYDRFAKTLALDGDRAVIGAPDHQLTGPGTGSAYLFERTGSTWSQTQKITLDDVTGDFNVGGEVGLEGDTLMIGCVPVVSGSGTRGVCVFHPTGTSWREVDRITRPVEAVFGNHFALDGNRVLISDSLLSCGEAYVYARPPESGFRYCFGDPGVDTPCPCSNDNDGSVPGSGCDNGVFASGAQLTGYGEPSVAADEVFLRTTHVEPHNSGLYFQGSMRVNGGAGVVFGDGLRCAGGQVKRLQVRFATDSGVTSTTIPLAQKGGVNPGDVCWYQYWYRTTVAPPCGLWVNDFNTSNGVSITWGP